MQYPSHNTIIQLKQTTVHLCIPDADTVRDHYIACGEQPPFPFWSRIWPSATGLCLFLEQNIHLITNKRVLEIGAGLGLPSIFAAREAKEVVTTDYLPEPLAYVTASALENNITNLTTAIFNWQDNDGLPGCDVLLLSDINYETNSFAALQEMISQYLRRQTLVLLSTPQRLSAREFISRFNHSDNQTETFNINETTISVYLLNPQN